MWANDQVRKISDAWKHNREIKKKIVATREKKSFLQIFVALWYFATIYIINIFDIWCILVARNTWDRNGTKFHAYKYDLWRLCEVITILRLDMQLHGQRYLVRYIQASDCSHDKIRTVIIHYALTCVAYKLSDM